MLGSDKSGEVIAAAGALKRTLAAGGKDVHDLAAAVVTGFHPSAPPAPAASMGSADAESERLAGYGRWLHWPRNELRGQQRERVSDFLLGTAFRDTGDVCIDGHLRELRSLIAMIQARR